MILHKLRGEDLEEWDLEKLRGMDEVWYFYESAPYEGSGQMLVRKGSSWDIHDMGHCSCYGPTENFRFIGRTLKEVYARQSGEYRGETQELFDAAGLKAEESS